ncbi:hypothetical protein ACF07T_19730 [Streptomyces sp. NPDC015184]|uniref:hypothetical protein n=1 Tax=Streptomyces sp. NPDC015184 TaxID=3364946 RepID=UPI0036FEF109
MLELLPGIGVELPGGAGTLRFGAGPEEALARLEAAAPRTYRGLRCGSLTLADYSEPRHAHDAWCSGYLHQPEWNVVAEFDGVRLTLDGGGPDAADRLARIRITGGRPGSGARGPGAVWDGVDLFGHPAEEVLAVLPEPVRPPEARGRAVVPRLSLCLDGQDVPAGEPWRELVLAGDGNGGWESCCRGRFGCAAGGDGMVGIML